SGFALRSISAYRDSQIQYINDTDYAPIDLIVIDYQDEYTQLSQEFQIISPDEGALKYVAGLYLYQQESDSVRVVNSSGSADALFKTDSSNPTTTDGTVDTDSVAVFLNGSYQINDNWKLGLGFRWSEETKEVDWMLNGLGSGVFFIDTGHVQDERTDSHFSPTINLNYAFGEDMNTYIKYSSGYKSGGFNLDYVNAGALAAGIRFDKETVESYEIGFKGRALDDRLSFSLAAFSADYEDYQVNQFVDLGGGRTSITIRNAAEVETQGVEFEFTLLLSDKFKLMGSAGILDAEFASYPGGAAAGADATGNSLPYVAEFSGALGAQYFHPLPEWGAELMVRLDYTYSDDFYTDANNSREYDLIKSGTTVQYGWVDARDLIHARIALQGEAGDWAVSLWGRNLADEEYLTDTGRDFFGTLRHFSGTPRTYGMEVEYNF
ncbi:MAG: TonB-dependent receptor, partial [Cellvibrionaceae bacterium]|nr:TonB-dependent receptor [Cellvibrionaceae bacterium]